MIYTIGDSFTYGDELDNPKHAWPYILGDLIGYHVDNLARNGASNDYIVKTTVEYLESNAPDLVILAWTTPDRIDIGGKTATVNLKTTFFSIISGVASANYITPIVLDITRVDMKYQMSVGFILGFLGLKGVEFISNNFLKKTGNGNTDAN